MDIQKYIDEYINWIKDEITYSQIGEYFEINTPFLDADGDYFQFYVKLKDNDFYFTDDGYTINNLEMSGFKMTKSREQQLTYILNQYGVKLAGKELTMNAPCNEFAKKKHAFTQCLIRVSDLYVSTRAKVNSYFLDDIQEFFLQYEIYSVDNAQYTGKSGFNHNYDFTIPRSKIKPERLCLAINNPNKTAMGNAIFAWEDTKPSRKPGSQLIIFLNDNNPIGKGVEDAFSSYEINSIRWSQRTKQCNIDLITA